MTVYRKDCLARIVKLSPSDAFKVAKLHWMSWNTRKKPTCGQMAFRHLFPLEISRNHDKPPVLSSFSRRRDSGFARVYIYIYIIDILYTDTGHIYTPKTFGKMNLSLTCGPPSCCRSCRPLAPGSVDVQRRRWSGSPSMAVWGSC